MGTPAPTPSPSLDLSLYDPMRREVQMLFGIYMIAILVVIVYLLVMIWPTDVSALATEKFGPVTLFGRVSMISLEVRFLLIVVLMGALGSYIHAATSFVDYVGNRKFVKSWTWWYLMRPFIGVALAILVYFAVRGGLVSATTGAGSLSPYGVAAIAGLAGLFSRQATDKLREVFETLFKTDHPPQRADKLTG